MTFHNTCPAPGDSFMFFKRQNNLNNDNTANENVSNDFAPNKYYFISYEDIENEDGTVIKHPFILNCKKDAFESEDNIPSIFQKKFTSTYLAIIQQDATSNEKVNFEKVFDALKTEIADEIKEKYQNYMQGLTKEQNDRQDTQEESTMSFKSSFSC